MRTHAGRVMRRCGAMLALASVAGGVAIAGGGCGPAKGESAGKEPRTHLDAGGDGAQVDGSAPPLTTQTETLVPVPGAVPGEVPGGGPTKADEEGSREAKSAVAGQRGPVLRDFLPHVRLDAAARVVEFDGVVPIDAHDERVTRVYLEVLACSRDTREHEAVVVTEARPSHVHAALLAIGLEPGKPGSYSWEGEGMQASAPTGPRVRVEVIVGVGEPSLLTDWAIDVRTGQTLTETLRQAGHGMLFAGSVRIARDEGERYLGDGDGTLVGLSTFGTETVASESMFNPDSAVEEPVWIANAAMVPVAGTKVRVRIRPE